MPPPVVIAPTGSDFVSRRVKGLPRGGADSDTSKQQGGGPEAPPCRWRTRSARLPAHLAAPKSTLPSEKLLSSCRPTVWLSFIVMMTCSPE